MAPAIAAEVSSWIQLYRPYELSNAPIPLLSVRLCARSDLKGSLDFLRSGICAGLSKRSLPELIGLHR